jgi:energy-coupling factor transport system ATP-binding protein
MKPEVLVLDEPAAGLDPYSRDEILNAVSRMHKELNLTVVLVSHSMEDISRYADRILVMSDGEVEMFDTVANVFKNADRLTEIGLAVPQITMIMKRLCKGGVDLPKDVYTMETAVEILSKALSCEPKESNVGGKADFSIKLKSSECEPKESNAGGGADFSTRLKSSE